MTMESNMDLFRQLVFDKPLKVSKKEWRNVQEAYDVYYELDKCIDLMVVEDRHRILVRDALLALKMLLDKCEENKQGE